MRKIIITAGDPLGIGPEIIVKALKNPKITKSCIPIVVGSLPVLKKYGFNPNKNLCIDISNGQKLALTKPKPTASGGILSFKALKTAVKLCTYGKADGLVTAPICKKSWQLAGIKYNGHSDYFRKVFKKPDALMIFVSKNIKCALLTEHLPLKRVPEFITKQKVISVCKNFQKALKTISPPLPLHLPRRQTGERACPEWPVVSGVEPSRRVGVRGIQKKQKIVFCGLNPHLGDGGVFANEEEKIIKPALKKLQNFTLMPADSAWQNYIKGNFAGIICTYHDQALIPIKTLSASPVVHWTYGLRFMRTSPAHGTAFDIAGKKKSDASSLIESILFASKFCKKIY
jgi:4-hydroxythreonine-4-phosphate dehydrogenase